MDPYLVKKGDFPRISDGLCEISVGSKGLMNVDIYMHLLLATVLFRPIYGAP